MVLGPLAFGGVSIYGYQNPMYPDPIPEEAPVTQAPVAQKPPAPPPTVEQEESEPPVYTNAIPTPPSGNKRVPEAPTQPVVVFHWVDEDGIDTYSDAVPPEAAGKAERFIVHDEQFVRWS